VGLARPPRSHPARRSCKGEVTAIVIHGAATPTTPSTGAATPIRTTATPTTAGPRSRATWRGACSHRT